MPSKEKLIEIVGKAKDYLNTGHTWIAIDIDNSSIESSQFIKNIELGKLYKVYSPSRRYKGALQR